MNRTPQMSWRKRCQTLYAACGLKQLNSAVCVNRCIGTVDVRPRGAVSAPRGCPTERGSIGRVDVRPRGAVPAPWMSDRQAKYWHHLCQTEKRSTGNAYMHIHRSRGTCLLPDVCVHAYVCDEGEACPAQDGAPGRSLLLEPV